MELDKSFDMKKVRDEELEELEPWETNTTFK